MSEQENRDEYGMLMTRVKSRRSCRDFSGEAPSDRDVGMVMEAGRWTPSSHNSQNSYVIRIKDPAAKDAIRERTRMIMRTPGSFDPFYGAPEILVVVNTNAQRDLALLDGSMTVYNMLLAADAVGLGACWVNTAQHETGMDDSILRRICGIIGIDGTVHGVGYVALGRPSKRVSTPLPRKDGRVFTV